MLFWKVVRDTCVERRDLAIVARPEVVALVLGVLGRVSVVFVRVLDVHGCCCSFRCTMRFPVKRARESNDGTLEVSLASVC